MVEINFGGCLAVLNNSRLGQHRSYADTKDPIENISDTWVRELPFTIFFFCGECGLKKFLLGKCWSEEVLLIL